MFNDIPAYFKTWGDSEEAIIKGVETMASSGETWIYREAFRYLIGHDVQDLVAEKYWREALVSWNNPGIRKSGRQQLRAALLDYLYHVVGERFGSPRDGRTGLFTQSFFKNYIEHFLAYLKLQPKPSASILSIGVDGLASYAHRNGATEADRALRQIAEVLRSLSREQDIISRHQGGFAVFMPGVDIDQAMSCAEEIRKATDRLPCRGPREILSCELSLSIGLSSLPNHGLSGTELLRSAREGMELARKQKNCVQTTSARLNRRLHKRHAISSVLDYSPRCEKEYNHAIAYDISDRGASFGCELDLIPGSSLLMRFRKPFWPQDLITPATIIRSGRHKSSEVYRLCVQFDKPLYNFCDRLASIAA